MATAKCVATIPASTLFTLDNVSKGKITSITVDNQGVASNTIIFQDSFTPDPTVGAPAPGPVVKVLKQVTADTLTTLDLSERDLQDIEVLGALLCLASVADPLCVITIGYHEI